MVRDILAFLLETEDEGEFKDLYDPAGPQWSYCIEQDDLGYYKAWHILDGSPYGYSSRKTDLASFKNYADEWIARFNVMQFDHPFPKDKNADVWKWYHWCLWYDGPKGPKRSKGPKTEAIEDEGEFKDISHPEIRQIEVHVKTWWRRGYGGTYYTARIIVNDKLVGVLPENFGSENVALQYAFRWLRDNGYIDIEQNDIIQSYCERNGIKLIRSTTEVRRERDLDRPL